MDFDELRKLKEKTARLLQEGRTEDVELNALLEDHAAFLDHIEKNLERYHFLEAIADTIDLNIAANATDNTYVFCNENTAKVFGKDVVEMQDRKPEDILPSEQAEQINAANAQVYDNEETIEFEMELETRDGLRHYDIVKGPMELRNGTKLVYTIGRDVTTLRKMERERQMFREILIEALNTIPEGFVVFDQDDRLFICNDAYLDIYQTSSSMIKPGARFEDIVRWGAERGQYPQAGTTKENVEKWIRQRVQQHLNPPEGAILQKTDDGKWLKIDERKTQSGYIVGIRADVTQIKNAEELLKQQTKKLERQAIELRKMSRENMEARARAEAATIAKSNFLAIISHELRTPMTGILGLTDLLLESARDEDQIIHLKNLKASAGTLQTLLNDILDYSKFEAGKLEFEKIDFNLLDLLEDVRQLLQNNASSKGLGFEVRFEGGHDDYIFKSDPTRIRQVLLNLASNAIKFSNQGTVVISASKERKSEGVYLEIEDSGIGIPEELQHKLFKPFTQADESTTRKYGGTGLGLSICKMIVEGLGGKIALDSKPGRGTRFYFNLPLPAGCKEQLNRIVSANASDTQGRFNYATTLSILLVEDNRINRTIISTVLKRIGHVVMECENGQEAVNACLKETYDIVLMDMQMPVMDGASASRKIRQKNATVPIIALTADINAADNPDYADCGINRFVHKPVDWEKLEETIEELVFQK